MSVEVRIPTVFRKLTGNRATVEVAPGSLGGVVAQLENRYPGLRGQILTTDGELHRFINVYLNDEDVRYLAKLDTEATEGDTISLLPSVAGG